MKKFILILAVLAVFPLFQARAQGGKIFSLDETLKELGVVLSWDPLFASGTLNRGDHRLKFYSGLPGENGTILLNSREILTLPLPYLDKGVLCFPEAFVAAAKRAFPPVSPGLPPSSPPPSDDRLRIAAIIIDPGHGGRDPGAVGTHTVGGKTFKSVEKDIVLSVSKKLAVLLNSAYPEKKILLTRTGDTYPSLEDRVNVANTVPLKDNEAIIYVSIHANASLNKSARGYEVWYLPPETQRELIDRDKQAENAEVAHILNKMLEAEFFSESTRMGRFILDNLRESLGDRIPSRGLKAENWYVVRNARMPAILVELGFVSNLQDAQLMADERYLKLYSEALYKGIAKFVTEFEQSGGYTASLGR
ncbi:MAG: N-acetylmuramoyl-L-alanine amidase [Treponema sp.]|nr:N-acetylmuramoyl-L-alanine amidase [Treponema sp.]